jgi:hypothetical protein
MRQTVVLFNEHPIVVQFHGSDEKQIPFLLSALKHNKITLTRMEHSPSYIELYGSEAIIHTGQGNMYRIPIF